MQYEIGPRYRYPNMVMESWESDNVFAGAGPHATIAFSKTLTQYVAPTATAYVAPRDMRLVEIGWTMQYAAGGGVGTTYDLVFDKNGVATATHSMAVPLVGLLINPTNLGGGRFSQEVGLARHTDWYGVRGVLTGGTGVSVGICTINLWYEVIG